MKEVDPHLRWLRRRIARHLLFSSGLVAAAVSVAMGSLLFGVFAFDVGQATSWALLSGQAVAVARLLASLWANPLTLKYLADIVDSPPVLRPARLALGTHPVATELAKRGFLPVVSAVVEGRPVFDIFQTSNRLVTAAVGRETGSLTLVSALPDGRTMVTANMVVLPSEPLVVNLADTGDCAGVVEAHRLGMGRLIASDLAPVAAASSVIADVFALEQHGYGALGWLGSFLNLRVRRSFFSLLATVSPLELWGLAIEGDKTQVDSARTPDYRAEEMEQAPMVEAEPSEIRPSAKLQVVG
ncbi:MAG: hypothetical protein V3V01_13560 [Acidimicrobiales bacterium]